MLNDKIEKIHLKQVTIGLICSKCLINSSPLLLSLPEGMLIDFRGRGREREREGEEHGYERETLMGCLSHIPLLGLNLQTWHMS